MHFLKEHSHYPFLPAVSDIFLTIRVNSFLLLCDITSALFCHRSQSYSGIRCPDGGLKLVEVSLLSSSEAPTYTGVSPPLKITVALCFDVCTVNIHSACAVTLLPLSFLRCNFRSKKSGKPSTTGSAARQRISHFAKPIGPMSDVFLLMGLPTSIPLPTTKLLFDDGT